jgi:transmembrane sensor
MSSPSPDSPENTLRATAARWAVRRDRGLSAAESIDYELWLAADPRHAAAMQRTSAAWSLLDRIPESAAAPILAAATRRRSFWRRTVAFGSLAAAALAVGLFVWSRPLPADPTH